MGEKVSITMTDDSGHFWVKGKLYKLIRFKTDPKSAMKGIHRAVYVEVDPETYDKRVEELTNKIASFPGVDLKDVLRDALYDMPLNHLSRLEKRLEKEIEKAKETATLPRVETKRGERGTCVELRIGGYYGMNIRV